MARYGKVGAFRQVGHPRIRGALDPSHKQKRFGRVFRMEDYRTDEETYFVPSFSIRRHLHQSEEQLWDTNRRLMARRLGRGFMTMASSDISLKVVEQHRLIKNMREAQIHPEPEEIRDIAYTIRDNLTDMLGNARSPLEVKLGDLGRFGYKENAVAYTIDGWRGDRALYGENDENAIKDNYAVLLAERQIAVGAIALAFDDDGLRVDGIAPCPHLTIARSKENIHDSRMQDIRGMMADLALESVKLGDPVIELRMYRDAPVERIPIKHSWQSLAPVPDSLIVPMDIPFESSSIYDRYAAFADETKYA